MQPVIDMTSAKAPVRMTRFEDLEFSPRFEYGDMAEVAGICGAEDGSAGEIRLPG